MNDSPLETPTLVRLVGLCAMIRQPGTVLVRYPKPDRITGLLIVGVDPGLARKANALLMDFVGRNRDRIGTSRQEWSVGGHEDLNGTFERLEATSFRWAWCGLETQWGSGRAFWFLGDQLCLEVAELLNSHGLPVPLPDAATAARTYQERMRKRAP